MGPCPEQKNTKTPVITGQSKGGGEQGRPKKKKKMLKNKNSYSLQGQGGGMSYGVLKWSIGGEQKIHGAPDKGWSAMLGVGCISHLELHQVARGM